ncbi:FAD-dependent oxidoreductase [Nocardia sp. ET3-3]|uniref:FAD-dependent oxidoreductase n=1 Tax=Nocardia terrae TaxID=2675851 RepID=A0A7K1V483_9NOCA|nr:NAD(P)/FAD-dependent oxidoreductase [Nocardia terrae]MVU81301.1 FAD-dependent oxidoreductase [Nocardia terrae]
MHENYDVIVVGGGPAGSTTAGLLAKRGRRVLLLEKEKFPRYHIGESLVPGLMPVLDELGATESIEASGAIRKYGISLIWGRDPQLWQVDFGEATEHSYAYEVKRAEFDNILLTHARRLGVTVIEEASVHEVIVDNGRCVGVRFSSGGSNAPVELRAPFIVDASGQAKLVARELDVVEWHEDLKNLATWTYFQGGVHPDGKYAGNIVLENRPPGWLWLIPFSDNTCSVGFVAPTTEYKATGLTPTDVLKLRIEDSIEIKARLQGAIEVAKPRTTKDWSYTNRQMSAPGCLMVGDAAAFIDPLFSTGCMLAMKGASAAARTIDVMLDQPDRESELRASYEEAYRNFLEVVISYVRFFYDPTRQISEYFDEAQNLIDPNEKLSAREDFILLISGLRGKSAIMDPLALADRV